MGNRKVITRESKLITGLIEVVLDGASDEPITEHFEVFMKKIVIGSRGEPGSYPDFGIVQKLANDQFYISICCTGAKQGRQFLQLAKAVLDDYKKNNKALIMGVKIKRAIFEDCGFNDTHKLYLSGGEFRSKKDLARDLAYGFGDNFAEHNGLKNFTYKKNGIVMYAITDKKKLDDKQDSVPFLTYAEAKGKKVKRKLGWADVEGVTSKAKICYNVTLGFDFRGYPDLISIFEKWCYDYAQYGVKSEYNIISIKCFKNGEKFVVEQSFAEEKDYYALVGDFCRIGIEFGYKNILEVGKVFTGDYEFNNKPSSKLSYEVAELLASLCKLIELTDQKFQNHKFSKKNLSNGTLVVYKNQSQKVFDDRAKKPSEKIGLMTYVEFKSLAEGYSEITYNDPISTAAVGVDIQTSGISTIKDLEMTFSSTGYYNLISYNIDNAYAQGVSYKAVIPIARIAINQTVEAYRIGDALGDAARDNRAPFTSSGKAVLEHLGRLRKSVPTVTNKNFISRLDVGSITSDPVGASAQQEAAARAVAARAAEVQQRALDAHELQLSGDEKQRVAVARARTEEMRERDMEALVMERDTEQGIRAEDAEKAKEEAEVKQAAVEEAESGVEQARMAVKQQLATMAGRL